MVNKNFRRLCEHVVSYHLRYLPDRWGGVGGNGSDVGSDAPGRTGDPLGDFVCREKGSVPVDVVVAQGGRGAKL